MIINNRCSTINYSPCFLLLSFSQN